MKQLLEKMSQPLSRINEKLDETYVKKIPHIRDEQIKEFFELLWINTKVQCKSIWDFLGVAYRYYRNIPFARADLSVLLMYLFHSPYTISKRFLMKKGEKDVYVYGETPLSTLEQITKECRLSAHDTIYELGCGRGRTCFWLRYFVNAKVIGIEHISDFTQRANRIKDRLNIDKIEFRNEDLLKSDFTGGTVFYLYGTCYEKSFIEKLIQKFHSLPAGTKVITVSYPLSDYTKEPYEVMKCFPANFTWGTADVYLNVKK